MQTQRVSISTLLKMLTASLFILGAAHSQAEDAGSVQKACRADFSKFCPSIKPGGGRLAGCLKEHQSELSAGCQEKMKVVSSCGEQIKELCGKESDPKKIKQCAKEHRSEFNEECKSSITDK
ncbi:hypothetical protein AAKU64_002115 [Undibacterium sp. GrIS 1.8]|uniref:cysteine rich repeat-containing protein n=1 Tax=unclassified Undibacterium TaxID=2630295 RepID=UPI0033958238